MPVRIIAGEADWQGEITGFAAGYAYTAGSAVWHPTNPNTQTGNVVNCGSFGDVAGSLGVNKTLAFYHRVITTKGSAAKTFEARVYDANAAVAVIEISRVGTGYLKETGNPLVSYNYPANNVLYAQAHQTTSGVGNQAVACLFLARVT